MPETPNTAAAERVAGEVTDGLPQPARRLAILAICVGVAMSVLDGAIANIALPTVALDLRATPAASSTSKPAPRAASVRSSARRSVARAAGDGLVSGRSTRVGDGEEAAFRVRMLRLEDVCFRRACS